MKKVDTTSGYGDHYVHVKVKVPNRLTDKQRALMLAYAELEEDTPGIIRGITYKKDGKYIIKLSDTILNFQATDIKTWGFHSGLCRVGGRHTWCLSKQNVCHIIM